MDGGKKEFLLIYDELLVYAGRTTTKFGWIKQNIRQ
jgi:hypothetical protein